MGRPKRNVNRPKSKDVDVSDMEEYYDKVDSSASNFIYDAVDEYHENQDKEGMQKLSKLMRKPKPFSEVIPTPTTEISLFKKFLNIFLS